jgi:hypothetical protein
MDPTTLPIWLAVSTAMNAQRMTSMPASETGIMMPAWVLWVLFFTLLLPLFILAVVGIWSILLDMAEDLYDEISFRIRHG